MIARRLQYEIAARIAGPLLVRWQRSVRGRRKRRTAGPFGPPLDCTRKLKELMTRHYFAGRYADGAVPVAWVTSGFPVEILRPFGFHVVYPENHAALCSVQRLVPDLSDAVERQGYARDLCSYARTDLGCVATGRTPVGRLPRPDLLACCTNICQTVLYWYRALAQHFGVPLVLVDTPYVYGEAPAHHLRYVRDQLVDVARAAARVSRKELDAALLAETVARAKEGARLWGECLKTATARPAPWTGFDGFFHMAPIVALRGSEECNAYYRLLLDELRDRVSRGVGGINNERHRLVWDNLPVWFAVRQIATLMAERGFAFVCTSYTSAWADAGAAIDPARPFGSMACAYTHILLNQDLEHRLGELKRLAREYGCDGAVLHSDRSCKPYSIGQVDLKDRLAHEAGLRVLLLEADHGDPRAWSPELAENRLAAFVESFA